jgi:hypothetical protein
VVLSDDLLLTSGVLIAAAGVAERSAPVAFLVVAVVIGYPLLSVFPEGSILCSTSVPAGRRE